MRGVLEHAPEKIGALFTDVPSEVRLAWQLYRELGSIAMGYLQRACWDHGRRTGYFALDGWLVGWVGKKNDRRFQVMPGCGALKPESDIEKAWYFHIHRRNP